MKRQSTGRPRSTLVALTLAVALLGQGACSDGTKKAPAGGITTTPSGELQTSEAGGQATFRVVLDVAPGSNVTLALASSDSSEGTVSPAKVTFTPQNWNAPQKVTVSGVDDDEPDGSVAYVVRIIVESSDDARYANLDEIEVGVSNVDDDSAGVTVSPHEDLVTSEAGTSATFSVVLNARPTANVEIALASSDESEGTVSPSQLTFTPENWKAPQEVTVTGVDDDEADGSVAYQISTANAVSSDEAYDGQEVVDVSLTNTDDETPGITVSSPGQLGTSEAGGEVTFTVVLDSRPRADVQIGLSSSDSSEGVANAESLVFTPQNWNAPQVVTVTGVDDGVADGNQVYSIITAPATSTDTGYQGLDAQDVELSNTDDDTSGITVDPVEDLETDEGGQTASFTIVLNSEPTAEVTIALGSTDESEGTLVQTELSFTADNWNAPQVVTVTGVDDAVADGSQPYRIITGPASSDDSAYDGLDVDDVMLRNVDDDSPGILVSPTSGLATRENGDVATFTIVLTSQPEADVSIGLSSSDTSEGTLSADGVTFTAGNWSAPQEITVVGVDDAIADGNQVYRVVLGPASSDDAAYAGIDATDVSLTNLDDDSPGVRISPTQGLITTERGGSASFSIVLASQPSADVSIGLSSSDTSEGSVSPGGVTFTAENWNAPQQVTVTGVSDDAIDGDQVYRIITAPAVSSDPGYDGIDPANVSLLNEDNTPGVALTVVSPLTTDEGGAQAHFSLVLNSKPTAMVEIGLTSSDTSEGTLSTDKVVFTPDNWDAPQQVTVTGADDDVADGNVHYSIVTAPATSADGDYHGYDVDDPAVINFDDEIAGLLAKALDLLVTSEKGGTARFTVQLRSRPAASVTLPVSSSDTSEADVAPASLTFTPDNWGAPQTVTVSGQDDSLADGNQPYTVQVGPATTSDEGYVGKSVWVALANIDDETAGVTVAPRALQVKEDGSADATFAVLLNAQPSADVVVPLKISDESEGTLSVASLTFTPDNWNAPQNVQVQGVDDEVADGNQVFLVYVGPLSSSDTSYDHLDAPDVSVTNIDDETASIVVTPTDGLVTDEAGDKTGSFTVRLTSEPTADVIVPIVVSDASEGNVSVPQLTFTSSNWTEPQTVLVSGQDDDQADGNQPYRVRVGPANSTDNTYNGLSGSMVEVVNQDDETPGFTVTPSEGLVTSEDGSQATFTVVLNSRPLNAVSVALTVDESEGVLSTTSLSFSESNWNTPQTVTITGADDQIQDGNQLYEVTGTAAGSADPAYAALVPFRVQVVNTDND